MSIFISFSSDGTKENSVFYVYHKCFNWSGVVILACSPSTGEVEADQDWGHPQLHTELQASLGRAGVGGIN